MSLKIASSRIRDAVLKGVPATGPPSLKSRWARLRYRSPEGLDGAFDEAMRIVAEDAETHRREAAQSAQANPDAAEEHAARAEIHNPEVKYNHRIQQVDLNLPVYKLLAKRDWQRRAMLVLMQRLEQHHVIPDTLPTLDPQADVRLKFVTPQMRNIEPGEFVANQVALRAPRLEIRDFGVPAGQSAKYTVLIVNPDVPDVENDAFSTQLHFAATNVEAKLSSPAVDFFGSPNVQVPYLPPMPEKNGPVQRMCVWVFRQHGDLDGAQADLAPKANGSFDIREFAAENNLEPVGASLWRSRYDLSSPMVREIYGAAPGRVFFRARTAKPEEALLHITERKKWMKVDGLE